MSWRVGTTKISQILDRKVEIKSVCGLGFEPPCRIRLFLKTVIRDVPFQSSDVPNVQQGALNSTSGTAPIFIST